MRPGVFKLSSITNGIFCTRRFVRILFYSSGFSYLYSLRRLIDGGIALRDIKFIYGILATSCCPYWTDIHCFKIPASSTWAPGWTVHLLYEHSLRNIQSPIHFLTQSHGTTLRRIEDHMRVENLITSSPQLSLTSSCSIIYTMLRILQHDCIGNISFCRKPFYFCGYLFLHQRAHIDVERFDRMTVERDKVYEILSGMQEIKLQNLRPSI